MAATPAAAAAAVYCLKCGRVAVDAGPALGAGLRIIVCRWADKQGKQHGCGRQPGTVDAAVAGEIVEAARRRRIAAQHPNHPNGRRFHQLCPACVYAGRHDLHLIDFRRAEGCDRCAGITPHDYHVANRQLGDGCPECGEVRRRLQPLGHAL